MIINLNPSWRIRSEPLNWICEQRMPGSKAKRHKWKPRAYMNTFDRAVVWCGSRRVMDTPGEYHTEALPPLVAALDTIVSEVRAALSAYQNESPEAVATACRAKPQNPSDEQSKKDREVVGEDT